MSIYTDAKYMDVPYEEKLKLFKEVKDDMRYDHNLYGCYECGICVAACPSARFYDFSPRVFAQIMAREDVDTFYELFGKLYKLVFLLWKWHVVRRNEYKLPLTNL